MVVGSDLLQRPVAKGIDIAVVIGEQDIVLEVLDRGAGIVLEPFQREVDAGRIEQSERVGLIRFVEFAVSHFVTDIGEFGAGEPAGEFGR